jgi:pimeloyl-ACP methyl ester carboxylesterase
MPRCCGTRAGKTLEGRGADLAKEEKSAAPDGGSANGTHAKHVVILVHGIRDFALWQAQIRPALEGEEFDVEVTNYGRFNLLEFLSPFPYFRRRAIATVWNQIRIIKQNYEGYRLSIIAHSFGTFVIAQLMKTEFDIKFHRVIFCGSVVRYEFPFEQFQDRFDAPLINEVGTRDVWPAIAESVTTGYGSAGTYGFRRPLVRDRWHNGARHGFFLNSHFCTKFWCPFLRDGAFVPGASEPEPPRLWLQLLTIFKLKYMLTLTAVAAVIVVSAAGARSSVCERLTISWFCGQPCSLEKAIREGCG